MLMRKKRKGELVLFPLLKAEESLDVIFKKYIFLKIPLFQFSEDYDIFAAECACWGKVVEM